MHIIDRYTFKEICSIKLKLQLIYFQCAQHKLNLPWFLSLVSEITVFAFILYLSKRLNNTLILYSVITYRISDVYYLKERWYNIKYNCIIFRLISSNSSGTWKNTSSISSIIELCLKNHFRGSACVLSNNIRKQMFDINSIPYNILFHFRHDKEIKECCEWRISK